VLRIMTWNVENFFVPQPADRAAYDAKVAELAEVITTAAPDLLALQEVGDEESFETLRDALGAGWTGGVVDAFRASSHHPSGLALTQ
jgi:endonuclease/exonuclease/phosphatase family metal-dependent hydrolase